MGFNRKNEFASMLMDMITNPPQGSVPMNVTPTMAGAMLAHNTNNRPCTEKKVKHYARQMASGDWRHTRVPIIFSDQGRLIDGQHRLSACIESDTSFTTDVAFGAPDESFAFIDVGKGRTSGDIFPIHGVQNASIMAAATGWVYRYDQGNIYHSNLGNVTAAELYAEFIKHPDLPRSTPQCTAFKKSRLASPSMMVAMHYLCARKCRQDADRFFEVANEGIGAKSKTDPALVLHKRLIKNATNQEKLPISIIAGLTLTAWNRYREGRSGRGLAYSFEMKFPRVR